MEDTKAPMAEEIKIPTKNVEVRKTDDIPLEMETSDFRMVKPLHEHTIPELLVKQAEYEKQLYEMRIPIHNHAKTIVNQILNQIGKTIKGLTIANVEGVYKLKEKIMGRSMTVMSDRNLIKEGLFKSNTVDGNCFGNLEVEGVESYYYVVSSANPQELSKLRTELEAMEGVDVFFKTTGNKEPKHNGLIYLDWLDFQTMQILVSHWEMSDSTLETFFQWMRYFQSTNISIYQIQTGIKQAGKLYDDKVSTEAAQKSLAEAAKASGKKGEVSLDSIAKEVSEHQINKQTQNQLADIKLKRDKLRTELKDAGVDTSWITKRKTLKTIVLEIEELEAIDTSM